MALSALQVEQAGSGKPKALGPGKHHDGRGLYLEVATQTRSLGLVVTRSPERSSGAASDRRRIFR